MGNTGRGFPVHVELVNLEYGQIRHNSLEAVRIAANRQLELRLDTENYFMKAVLARAKVPDC
jgi:large subunit ribosomal protein L10e